MTDFANDRNREELLDKIIGDNPHLDVARMRRVSKFIERARELGIAVDSEYSLVHPFAQPAANQSWMQMSRKARIRFVSTENTSWR